MSLIDKINFQNKHWSTGKFETYAFKRYLFSKIWVDLQTKLAALITGPRRTGKSELLKQLVNELISFKKVIPTQILFYEFSPQDKIEKIWQVYRYFIKEVSDPRSSVYLFFDEIQFVKGYEIVIKEIYDATRAKIFLTGSLSLSYKKRMDESLSGRFFHYKLMPLNFAEYLELSHPEEFILFKNTQKESNQFKRQHNLSILNSEFRHFLALGRLPEIVNFTKDQARAYITNIISQSLNQDAFSYFNIEKPQVINSLFEFLRVKSGGLISSLKLSKDIGVAMQTIVSYLNVLDIMGLTYFVYNSINPLIKSNASKKAYVSSMYFLNDTKLELSAALGLAVESYVLERLLEKGETVTFFKKRQREIDFLLPRKKIAYEVKFRSEYPLPRFRLKDYILKIISLDGDFPACLL